MATRNGGRIFGHIAHAYIPDGGSALENDTILPKQFFTPPLLRSPEKRLIAAVLEDALQVYNQHRKDGDNLVGRFYTLWRNAYVWLTDLEEDRIFSLGWCCEALGIDVAALAKKVVAREPIARLRHSPTVRNHNQITLVPARKRQKKAMIRRDVC